MPGLRMIACAGLAALTLAGCSQSLGSVGGASVGSEPGPALTSGPLGEALDERDRKAAVEAEYRALEFGRVGTPVAWKNKKSGVAGEVTPGPSYKVNVFDCRDMTHTATVGGQILSARGTACRRPDGNWKPIT
jgi:surface antigen